MLNGCVFSLKTDINVKRLSNYQKNVCIYNFVSFHNNFKVVCFHIFPFLKHISFKSFIFS